MLPLQQWNSAVDLYNQNMGEDGDDFNKNIIGPALLALLGDYKDKIILDSGCGSGYFTVKLATSAKKVIGTDFSQLFIDVCKNKYQKIQNLEFVQHDITTIMPFKNNFFDCIISKMVLQYVQNLDVFAMESHRVLKDNGSPILAVDHPLNTQFYYAQQVSGKPNPRYGTLNDYFNRSEHTKLSLWNKVKLTWYPKTVGDYIIPFVKVGLILSDIVEMPEEKNGIKIPRILALKFKK